MRAPTVPARGHRLLLAGGLGVAIITSSTAPALAAGAETTDEAAISYVAVLRDDSGVVQVEQLDATPSRLAAEVASLDAAGDVVALEPDQTVHALGMAAPPASSDPLRSNQWALDEVPFEGTWPTTAGDGIVVAVVDSGVEAGLEDLAGAVLPGWDATTDRPGGTTDKFGHGTHVAGIIAARAGNRAGVRGAAPGVQILPVRVLGADGSGSLSDVTQGIVWAVDHGADIINLSLGGAGGGTSYRSVLGYARQKGVVVVAAAGNDALKGNPVIWPGADPDVITVASVAPDGSRAPSSTFGSWVDVAAPGTGILSTCPAPALLCGHAGSDPPAGYAYMSGTSMATPHVAGAAALLLAARPDLSPAAVQALLESSAHDLGPAGADPEFGAGLIDPLAALGGTGTAPTPDAPAAAPGDGPDTGTPGGYWVVGRDGRVVPFGSAPDLGGVSAPAAPIVAAAATPTGRGYWLAGADGGVFTFGDAAFYGSTGGIRQNSPIVGMAATVTGHGYWLLGADGGVFTFGDAGFYGSTGGMRLNRPVVDMAPSPTGRGYWLVATDGGIFAFGDAGFHGSLGSVKLNQAITSVAATAGGGYWMIGGDGGIFTFGDAAFHGSLPGMAAVDDRTGKRIRATGDGAGYYILGDDGRVFSFGAATPHGSIPGLMAADLVLAG